MSDERMPNLRHFRRMQRTPIQALGLKKPGAPGSFVPEHSLLYMKWEECETVADIFWLVHLIKQRKDEYFFALEDVRGLRLLTAMSGFGDARLNNLSEALRRNDIQPEWFRYDLPSA